MRSLASSCELAELRLEVEAAGVLGALAARESEIALEHRLHVVDVLLQRLGVAAGAAQRQLQPEAGQDGPEVVADAGQHGRALLDLPLDALAHLDEGEAGAAHFLRAARLEIARHRPPLAEALGGLRQLQDRADLVAQEGNGDR